MAGLVPAIHAFCDALECDSAFPRGHLVARKLKRNGRGMRNLTFYVYIMTNRPNGILYVGVTNNLSRRAWEHREGILPGFTKRYGLKRLVYYETFDRIVDAIQREKNMKHWPRAWKVRLILATNPGWDDLYEIVPY